MTEKITGVCVDIPTIIKRAKAEYTFTKEFYKTLERASDKLAEDLDLIGRSDATIHLPQWISVKERLPEPYSGVLFMGTKGGVCPGFVQSETDPIFWDCFDNEQREATHWMPLPEPPKRP
jgi:hypothetical protein